MVAGKQQLSYVPYGDQLIKIAKINLLIVHITICSIAAVLFPYYRTTCSLRWTPLFEADKLQQLNWQTWKPVCVDAENVQNIMEKNPPCGEDYRQQHNLALEVLPLPHTMWANSVPPKMGGPTHVLQKRYVTTRYWVHPHIYPVLNLY